MGQLSERDGEGKLSLDASDLQTGSVTTTEVLDGTIANADVSASAAIDYSKLASLTSGQIIVGNGSNVPTAVAMSGNATIDNTGAVTIANNAITNAMIGDSAGISELQIPKIAIVQYDFAVDGGTAGTITLTGSPTIPDNAVVWLEAYEVETTCTSSTDAATITLTLPTDGDLFTAVAISAGSNPWDQGIFNMANGGAMAGSTPKKCTAARVPQLTVAGGENITAGKIIFFLRYNVST